MALQAPDYRGELVFDSTLQVDLDPMIAESGLDRADNYWLSRDGKTIRVDMVDENSYIAAYAQVYTATGAASWLATDIGKNTRMLFDAENTPVAVMAIACETVSYTPMFNDSLPDLSTLAPAGQCISNDPILSADGNVVLFSTYDPETLDPYDTTASSTMHAYTLDSASLVDYPDISLEVDGVAYSPRLSAVKSDRLDRYGFSDDGQQLLSQQWWEGLDSNGDVVRQVGAVLWNTVTGDWLIRGLTEDPRDCSFMNNRYDCLPPYSYVLSNDGNKQYFEIPGSAILEDFIYEEEFKTSISQALSGSETELPVEDTGTITSLSTNTDGDQIVFFAGPDSTSLLPGPTIYQSSSDTFTSLNRALRACPLTDEEGNDVDESDCQYTTGITGASSDAGLYTADGQHLLLRNIARYDAETNQAVDNFLLDVDTGEMYSLPESYGDNYQWINGDASVILGTTYLPEVDILIGRR